MKATNESPVLLKNGQSRIDRLFATKRERILSVFYTGGFPFLESTREIAEALEKSGVDMVEIGIPFSDPIADGPVIQASSARALANGMTLDKLLRQTSDIRKTVKIPILLMGYLNTLFQFGIEKFCEEASRAGVDGVIVPDLPLREFKTEYAELFKTYGLTCIFLVTPTTPVGRIREIDEASSGFIYAVSSTATTGSQASFSLDLDDYLSQLRALNLKRPWLVGFGVSNCEAFSRVCDYGSGAIIGSSFVSMLAQSTNLESDIAEFVHAVRK